MLYVGILQNTCEVFLEASRKFYKYLYVSMSWPSFYSSVFPTFRILCLSKSRKCWHIRNQNLKLGTHTMFKKASNWPKSGILHFKKNNLELVDCSIMQSWRHCCEISGLHSRVIESTWVSQASQGDLGQFSNPLMFLELIFKIPHFKYLLLLLFACKALLEKIRLKVKKINENKFAFLLIQMTNTGNTDFSVFGKLLFLKIFLMYLIAYFCMNSEKTVASANSVQK